MSKNILTLTILTLLTIIAWVFFSLWNVRNTSQISADIKNNIATPLQTTFDKDYLLKIYERSK